MVTGGTRLSTGVDAMVKSISEDGAIMDMVRADNVEDKGF